MTQRINPQLLATLGVALVGLAVITWYLIDVLPGTMTSVSLMALASTALAFFGIAAISASLLVRVVRRSRSSGE